MSKTYENIPIFKAVNGSILTLQCITELSKNIIDKFIFQFINYLPKGLSYTRNSDVIVSYSTDYGASYNILLNFTGPDIYENELSIILDPGFLPTDSINSERIFIKVVFKALVNNIDIFNSMVTDEAMLLGTSWHPLAFNDFEQKTELHFLIEKYDFIVTGYSLNTCSNSCNSSLGLLSPCKDPFNYGLALNVYKEDFTATFLFNTLNGSYGKYDGDNFINTAAYIITIKPTNGIQGNLDGINVFLTDQYLIHKTKINNIIKVIDNENLVIIIPHINEVSNDDATNISCNLYDNYILVTIPYSIYDCTALPSIIECSIQLIDTDDNILAFLDKFCLCVNLKCPNLMRIDKNILN